MFIYTITSFLYVFAYCSLQTAIRHVENIIVQNMKYVYIGLLEFYLYLNFSYNLDQQCGEPLFSLLTKTHQKFENILHPKILRIKNMLTDIFDRRRQLICNNRQIPEPKVKRTFLLFLF